MSEKSGQLSAGVHEVCMNNGNDPYVYKEIDFSGYEPEDSEAINEELRNLELFYGTKGIVQIAAAIVSQNPYHTSSNTYEASEAYHSDQSDGSNETNQSDRIIRTTPSTVLRGVLLEYHPNGTLADALQSAQEGPQSSGTWQRWALQIAEALACVHKQGVTHMDLKPSNILISAESNAILSDISGFGGTTREHLAPEMQDIPEPLAESMDSRVCNDIWALGKMFKEMGVASSNEIENRQLKKIGLDATVDDPMLRPPLQEIIYFLSA
jgi:serine/threonine protein kinase